MTYATRARTLDDIAADSHVFSIIAMDQRNTLRRMFSAVGLDASDDDLRVAKADVARVLTPAASGLLSDPTYGVPAIAEAKALAPGCGLLIAAEPAERRSYQGEPRTHRDPALNARWVLDQGGDALKFFVQLRADRPAPARPDLVAETLSVCQEVIDDCRATGVPVVIENLVYSLPGEDLAGRAREDAIIEAARALNDLDIDLLKLEYPGSPEGCRRLCAILDRPEDPDPPAPLWLVHLISLTRLRPRRTALTSYRVPRPGPACGHGDEPFQPRQRHRGKEFFALLAGQAHHFAPYRAAGDEARGAALVGGNPDDVGELVEGDPRGQDRPRPVEDRG